MTELVVPQLDWYAANQAYYVSYALRQQALELYGSLAFGKRVLLRKVVETDTIQWIEDFGFLSSSA